VRTMAEQIASTLWQQRLAAGLIGLFGLLALVLAAIGLSGVVAQAVAQRTHELGIRMALGAQSRDILRLIVGQGMTLALIGIVAGLVAALGLTHLMSNLLYGVSAADPATFVMISLLLTAVALLASYLPARRAARVEPMVALRHE